MDATIVFLGVVKRGLWSCMKIKPQLKRLIDQEVKSGYISIAEHPTKPLKIYNYTKKTQFEGNWNEATMWCRGLVLDNDNNIIIPCIRKFFNLGEPNAPQIELSTAMISEKLDGYYISFTIDPNYGMVITSRGSFTSQYARATQKYLTKEVVDSLRVGYSYFCELCENFDGDESIIVAKHKTPRLVCWAIKNENGEEILNIESQGTLLPLAKRFTYTSAKKYLANENVEGVVARANDAPMERVKIKTEWYLKMHRLISSCTKKRVWEIVRDGGQVSELDIPDEFMAQMLAWEKEIRRKTEEMYQTALKNNQLYENWSDRELGLKQPLNPISMKILWLIRKDKEQQALDFILDYIGRNLGS